jgi:hypothetical protein
MAWTATLNKKTVFGDMRVHMYELTSDSATLELDTGFDVVTHIQPAVKSANTFGTFFDKNVLSAGTASNGTVAITGSTSGDDFFLTVYGR